MQNILLISEKQVIEKSGLEINVDPKIISRAIVEVQDLQLKDVLGKTLFETVMTAAYSAATDNTYTMDSGTAELISDYIKPYLVYETVVDFISTNQYKLSNKGLLKINDANATPVSSTELEYSKNFYMNKLAGYKSRLIKYLRENKLIDALQPEDEEGPAVGWFIEKSNYDERWLADLRRYGIIFYN